MDISQENLYPVLPNAVDYEAGKTNLLKEEAATEIQEQTQAAVSGQIHDEVAEQLQDTEVIEEAVNGYIDSEEGKASIIEAIGDQIYTKGQSDEKFAPIDSPVFTGHPTVPDVSASDLLDAYFWLVDGKPTDAFLNPRATPSGKVTATEDLARINYVNGAYFIKVDTTWFSVLRLGRASEQGAYIEQGVYFSENPVTNPTVIAELDQSTSIAVQCKTYNFSNQAINVTQVNEKDVVVLQEAKAYADDKDATVLQSAKNYADGKDTVNLLSANDYTDTKVATTLQSAKDYADGKDATVLQNAKDYADNKDSVVLQAARDYAVSRVNPRSSGEAVHAGSSEIEGGLDVHGEGIFRQDLSVSGDIHVNGTMHINDTETMQTTDDYLVLRHNKTTGLEANEHAGIAVHNYTPGKTATCTADNQGTWRVADNTETDTEYTNISSFGTDYYAGLTHDTTVSIVNGIHSAFDADELESCVWYNGAYYHYDEVSWFTVLLVGTDMVIDAQITDTDVIAALEALTKATLIYYRRLVVTQIDEVQNQPVLTRAEEADFADKDILMWDATAKKAVKIPRPTMNNQVLSAIKVLPSVVTVITDQNGNFYDENGIPATEPSGTAGAPTNIGSYVIYNNTIYYNNGGEWFNYTDDVAVQDQELIDALEAETPVTLYTVAYTTEGQTGYRWKSGGSGSVSRFATLAETQAALAIPEGQDGYIPDNGIVIVDELESYIEGDDNE